MRQFQYNTCNGEGKYDEIRVEYRSSTVVGYGMGVGK